MTRRPGEIVYLAKLRKNGEISEVLSPGRYRVAVGSLSIQALESDLGDPKDLPVRSTPTSPPSPKTRIRRRTVDLHGLSVHDALQRVESELNRAIMDHVEELQLMHGKGSGKLLEAIHKYLGTLSVVRSFSLDPKNAGVTRVFAA